ncbi:MULTISPECIES: RNA polymerase sigma factor [Galbibacter]|uniref:RNA polymerase sigma factor n=1 Tax=Galbibacter pacificus TaxID=2996052 RepID=A0ABT6FM10_9FLAO|nr:RNA polymerase sigma factor [Galbibacter pacificus]MDG3580820.1 RNA polymerase sigma factor [Galbibacter pacificus]MDG3584298.1 RNA polymerase sigma factor [Galbibacter pacificus]
MSQLLEKNIITLLEKRDEKGMSLLYEYYGDTLFGVAMKITKDEDLAKDVLQISLMKIWKKIDTYDAKKSKLFTWMFRITRNTAIDKIRSANLKSDQEIQIEVSDVYNLGVESVNPEHIDIKKHLNSLDEKYKIVMEALFFKGMTQQEASEELDIPLGTIKSRLKIGLRELRRIYDPATLSILFYLIIQLKP